MTNWRCQSLRSPPTISGEYMSLCTIHLRSECHISPAKVLGGRVVRCRTCDREVAGSNPAGGCCVPTPTQCVIPPGSANEYQRKLGSKRAYHAMHWSRIRGLAASAGVRLRAKETEISAAPWPFEARERTLLYLLIGFDTTQNEKITIRTALLKAARSADRCMNLEVRRLECGSRSCRCGRSGTAGKYQR